jgi:hypothetical protein
MDEKKQHLQNLSEIRSLMERSSSFLSLSGLSGIFAGIFAIFGAAFAYWYIYVYYASNNIPLFLKGSDIEKEIVLILISDALTVLILALIFGLFFTYRNTKKKGLKIWNKTSRKLLFNLLLPLLAGGIFTFILIYHGIIILVASSTLIFYGLSLLNASKYTLRDIQYLGISEIILGLLSGIFVGYGLYFWVLGFGILHIVYGTAMYLKYEKTKRSK